MKDIYVVEFTNERPLPLSFMANLYAGVDFAAVKILAIVPTERSILSGGQFVIDGEGAANVIYHLLVDMYGAETAVVYRMYEIQSHRKQPVPTSNSIPVKVDCDDKCNCTYTYNTSQILLPITNCPICGSNDIQVEVVS